MERTASHYKERNEKKKKKKIRLLYNVAEERDYADSSDSEFEVDREHKVGKPEFKEMCLRIHRRINLICLAKPGKTKITNRDMVSTEMLDEKAALLRKKRALTVPRK